MNIEICSGPKTLNQGDGPGGGLRAFQPRLFDQKGGNGAVGESQNRREQLRMGGEQKSGVVFSLLIPSGLVAAAALGTVLHIVPVLRPFFSPAERAYALQTGFFRQMWLLMHVLMRLDVRHRC